MNSQEHGAFQDLLNDISLIENHAPWIIVDDLLDQAKLLATYDQQKIIAEKHKELVQRRYIQAETQKNKIEFLLSDSESDPSKIRALIQELCDISPNASDVQEFVDYAETKLIGFINRELYEEEYIRIEAQVHELWAKAEHTVKLEENAYHQVIEYYRIGRDLTDQSVIMYPSYEPFIRLAKEAEKRYQDFTYRFEIVTSAYPIGTVLDAIKQLSALNPQEIVPIHDSTGNLARYVPAQEALAELKAQAAAYCRRKAYEYLDQASDVLNRDNPVMAQDYIQRAKRLPYLESSLNSEIERFAQQEIKPLLENFRNAEQMVLNALKSENLVSAWMMLRDAKRLFPQLPLLPNADLALRRKIVQRYSETMFFVSYSRTNWDEYVKPLVSKLRGEGFGVWIDQDLIQGGDDWLDQLNKALADCKIMILCVSPTALESKYVRMEYRSFLDESKTIIPILCEPTNLPVELRGIQYLPYNLDILISRLWDIVANRAS